MRKCVIGSVTVYDNEIYSQLIFTAQIERVQYKRENLNFQNTYIEKKIKKNTEFRGNSKFLRLKDDILKFSY